MSSRSGPHAPNIVAPSPTTAFDVVVVPDFSGAKARQFEARTLLFLGAWVENAGRARGFPLHLACIGEPPPTVVTMAARSGAEITVHEPVRAERRGTSNKLRGLEIQGRTSSVLLLDVDIIVLGDPAELGNLGAVIAVKKRGRRVPESHWRRIYPALGLPFPEGSDLAGSWAEKWPYYNSGVIYAPWRCELRRLWEADIRAIAALFTDDDPAAPAVLASDQAGLATTLERIRRQGIPVVSLPPGFHVFSDELARIASPPGVVLFHATGVFSRKRLTRLGWADQLRGHRALMLARVCRLARRAAPPDPQIPLLATLHECYRVGRRLQSIWRRHVQPVLGG